MPLDELTSLELIFPDLPGTDVHTVLRAFADRVEAQGRVSDADDLYRRLWEREELDSTGLGDGVAIPHCKMEDLEAVILAIGLHPRGVDFAAVDKQPVHLFFLIVSPSDQPGAHLQALSAVSKWVKANDHVQRILELSDPQAIFELLRVESAQH